MSVLPRYTLQCPKPIQPVLYCREINTARLAIAKKLRLICDSIKGSVPSIGHSLSALVTCTEKDLPGSLWGKKGLNLQQFVELQDL